MTEIVEGIVYGYLDQLEAKLPVTNEVMIELEFRKEIREIPTKRQDNVFIIDRRIKLPLKIKLSESGEMQEKYIILRMYRIVDDEQRLFADFRVNLKDYFRPQNMEISTNETRAKMSNKPLISWSFVVCYKTDPRPPALADFVHAKLHGGAERESLSPKSKTKQRITHLEDAGEFHAPEDDSDASFDEDIAEHYIQLSSQDSETGIDAFIARNWFDLSKAEMGYPGYRLSRVMINKRGEVKTEFIQTAFSMLEDIRTTIKTVDSALSFYCSCLCFYNRVMSKPEIASKSMDLVYRSIDTAVSIVCDELQKVFMTSLTYVPGSTDFRKIILLFRRKVSVFKGDALKHLLDVILDQLDCNLCNAFITQRAFDTLTKVVCANTAIAEFESTLKVSFPRFRQVLLCIIAHDTILQDNSSVAQLVPLVPPLVIYLAMCLVKKDPLLPNAIDYRKLEAFANNMNINFQTNISDDAMFRRQRQPLPTVCSEFGSFSHH